MSLLDRIAGLKTSLAIKAPVDVATTEAIVLSGAQTIDGIAVVAGDRVLVNHQADATQNGIYDASNGSWKRSIDFNSSNEIGEGLTVYVKRGMVSENTPYILNTPDPITLGTTDIVFGFSTNSSAGSVAVVTAAQAATAAAQAAAEQAKDDAETAQAAAEAAATAAANSVLQFLGPWTTATAYIAGNLVLYQGKTYRCLINHTSDADFSVDLAAARWDIFAESTFDLNARLPVLSTGTNTTYAIALPDPPPALFVGLAGIIRFNVENGIDPTLSINGLSAIALQIRNEAGTLENLTPGLFGANETASFVVQAGPVVEITSQPLREVVAGPVLLPRASQVDDLDGLTEGGSFLLTGNWTNGPLGAGSFDYGAVDGVASVIDRGTDFVIQTIFLNVSGVLQEYRRVGEGDPLVWPSTWSVVSDGPATGSDLTVQRALGTLYTNNAGKPLYVYVSGAQITLGFGCGLRGFIGGLEIGSASTLATGDNQTNNFPFLNFVVPPGATYEVQSEQLTGSSIASLARWVEFS